MTDNDKLEEVLFILPEYKLLFEAFENESVEWCSWKSNEHLTDALSGQTDIDILFHDNDRLRIAEIMQQCGFVLFKTPSYRTYPGIVDYISINPESGLILHAHCHFLLCLGEKNVKSFIIPFEDRVLKNRIKSEISTYIYTSSPVDELILLLIREAVKSPTSSLENSNFQKELRWLKERTSLSEMQARSNELFNKDITLHIQKCFENPNTGKHFLELRSSFIEWAEQEGFRRMTSSMVLIHGYTRKFITIFIRILEKLGISTGLLIKKRVLPGGGLTVAFLGADGSGKSTITNTLVEQWQHKIDIDRLYFGIGSGSKNFVLRLLDWIQYFHQKTKKTAGRSDGSCNDKKSAWKVIPWAIGGVLHKRKQIRKIKLLKERGMIVVCDRWPQNQIKGINDGPLLDNYLNHSNIIIRTVARWEKRNFQKICASEKPDVVIRLVTPLDIALIRKKENKSIEEDISRKISTLNQIVFEESENFIINAAAPLNSVLSEVRSIIKNYLQKKTYNLKPDFYECVGISGAGKTTFCEMNYKKLQAGSVQEIYKYSKNQNIGKKIFLFLESLFFYFPLYAALMIFCYKTEAWKNKKTLKRIFQLPVQKLKLKKFSGTKLYILEQYLLQNIWSALMSAQIKRVKPPVLSPVIQILYSDLNAVILFFEISPADAARRVSTRLGGESRFDGLPIKEIEKNLNSYSRLMEDIINAARQAGLIVIKAESCSLQNFS